MGALSSRPVSAEERGEAWRRIEALTELESTGGATSCRLKCSTSRPFDAR